VQPKSTVTAIRRILAASPIEVAAKIIHDDRRAVVARRTERCYADGHDRMRRRGSEHVHGPPPRRRQSPSLARLLASLSRPCQSGPPPGHDSKGHPAGPAGDVRYHVVPPTQEVHDRAVAPVPPCIGPCRIVRGQSVDTRRANRPELGATDAAVVHTILPQHVLSRSARSDLGRAGTSPKHPTPDGPGDFGYAAP
jgi:hypothetical protein